MIEVQSSQSSLSKDSEEYARPRMFKPTLSEKRCSTRSDPIELQEEKTKVLGVVGAGFPPTVQTDEVVADIFTSYEKLEPIYVQRPVIKESMSSRKVVALDVLLNFTWVAMLTVGYWRGTWDIIDLYFYPDNRLFSASLSAAIGCTCCIVLNAVSPFLHSCLLNTDHSYVLLYACLHVYMFALATVAQWRGAWYLLDALIPSNSLKMSSFSAGIAICCLWILRSSLTAVTPPLAVNITPRDKFFLPQPRFRSAPTSRCRYTLDHAFSQLVIINMTILLWRAIWNVYSILIFPTDNLVSSLVNFSGACLLLFILLMIEHVGAKISRYVAPKSRVVLVLFENCYAMLAILGSVGYWRGAWMLIAEQLLSVDVGPWVCHIVGYTFLALTLACDTLSHRSIVVDGGERKDGIHWHIEYVGALLQQHAPVVRKSISSLSNDDI